MADGTAPAVVEHAARIATRAFTEVGIETIGQRLFDAGEAESLMHATEADGRIDLKTFATAQHLQRKELGIPDSHKTLSVLYSPTFVPTDHAQREVYGFSIREYAEAILSTHNLRMQLLKNPRYNQYAAHFFAYTMAHEGGHLLGLVSQEADRHVHGGHCANTCVMQSTSPSETADYLEHTGGAIHFCNDCAEDIASI